MGKKSERDIEAGAISPGQNVKLRSSGRTYQVIEGPNRKGLVRVACGKNAALLVPVADIIAVPESSASPEAPARPRTEGTGGPRTLTLDLHGMTVAEAEAVLEKAVSDALLNGADELCLVHGLGSGKLKTAVHAFLSRNRYVKSYKVLDGNPGTTVAQL